MIDRAYGIVCCIVLIAVASTACASIIPDQSVDQYIELLFSSPCPAPCLYGVWPGSTTLDEAERLLSEAGLCSSPGYINSSPGEPDTLLCESGVYVSTGPDKEITRVITFTPAEKLTVGIVVDHLGDPDAVMVDAFLSGEDHRSMMSIYYKKGFTRLMLPDQPGASYSLEQDTRVERVGYYEAEFFKEVLGPSPWMGISVYPPDR